MNRLKAICFALFFMMPIFSFAQIVSAWGIKTGLTFANQNWDASSPAAPDWQYRQGLNSSLFFEFVNQSHIHLTANFSYSQKGFVNKFDVISNSGETNGLTFVRNERLDYVSFSPAVKYQQSAGKLMPYVAVGPRFDLLINKQITGLDKNIFDGYQKKIFGVSAGIGTEIKGMFPFVFLIEAQYNQDITKSYSTEFLSITNRTFDLQFGIKL